MRSFHMSRGYSSGLVVWFTGLSGPGKSTICAAVCTELLVRGFRVEVLDGDILRKQLNSDLGFSQKDRNENIHRIGFVAQLLARNGVIVLVAAISPYRTMRAELCQTISNFMEVYVNAPLEVCEERDPKGLYRRARKRQISGFTGIDDPYEPPLAPQVECKTDSETVKGSSSKVVPAILAFFSSRSEPALSGSKSYAAAPDEFVQQGVVQNGRGHSCRSPSVANSLCVC